MEQAIYQKESVQYKQEVVTVVTAGAASVVVRFEDGTTRAVANQDLISIPSPAGWVTAYQWEEPSYEPELVTVVQRQGDRSVVQYSDGVLELASNSQLLPVQGGL